MELAACLNKVHTAKAIRQAKVHGTTTAYALQKVHQRECPSTGEPGDGGGKAVLPSIHGGLWGGHGILLTWELGGTSVPLTAPYQWHAASCPSWDVGYHPVVGHGRWRTSTCILHPKTARDASTTNRHKTLGPVPWTKKCQLWGRKKRKQWNLTTLPKSILAKKGKSEGWQQRPFK